ncbi:hypothetical protein Tco_0635572, partial [Tanacetum coccineum]
KSSTLRDVRLRTQDWEKLSGRKNAAELVKTGARGSISIVTIGGGGSSFESGRCSRGFGDAWECAGAERAVRT